MMTRMLFAKGFPFTILTALLFVGGAAFWASDLSSDPPASYGGIGLGQSLSTDPAHCVYHARNKVVFGDSDPFDFTRWVVIQRSLTSLTAHLWFSIAGVSLKQANTVGLFLSLGALLFFLLAIRRHHRPWVGAAITLCYLMNVSLMVHGRLPYLENGLIFITSLLFLVYSRWGDRSWGRCLCGILVAAAMLMGKLFGVLLLPALLLAEWFARGTDRSKRVVPILGAFGLGALVLAFLLYYSQPSSAYQYYSEGSYKLHGLPEGLSSPWAFAEHLISYGFANHLFRLSMDLPVFLWVSGFMLTLLFARGCQVGHLSRVSVLSAFTILCVWLGLSPLSYSPIRYGLLLIPPIIILFFTLLDYMTASGLPDSGKAGYIRFGILFLLLWQALFLMTGVALFRHTIPIRTVIWPTFPVALAATLLVRYFLINRRIAIGRTVLRLIPAMVFLFSIALNGYHLQATVSSNTTSSIKKANADLGSILADGAVVAGPYAPVLTLENDVKSFIYYFGVASVDPTLFQRYPITHLAIDSSSWQEAVRHYPVLKDMKPITSYNIHTFEVKICYVAALLGNPEARRYQETEFEKAVSHYYQGNGDSAMAALREFLRSDPYCRSANLLLVELHMQSGNHEQATAILTGLASRYPDDFDINLVCGRSFQIMGLVDNDKRLLALSRTYYDRAVRNNPEMTKYARYLHNLTLEQLGGQIDSTGENP